MLCNLQDNREDGSNEGHVEIEVDRNEDGEDIHTVHYHSGAPPESNEAEPFDAAHGSQLADLAHSSNRQQPVETQVEGYSILQTPAIDKQLREQQRKKVFLYLFCSRSYARLAQVSCFRLHVSNVASGAASFENYLTMQENC